MVSLSRDSRKTPQADGRQKWLNKLLRIGGKTGPFLETLGNRCMERLPVLYWKGGWLNGRGCLFWFETNTLTTLNGESDKAKW